MGAGAGMGAGGAGMVALGGMGGGGMGGGMGGVSGLGGGGFGGPNASLGGGYGLQVETNNYQSPRHLLQPKPSSIEVKGHPMTWRAYYNLNPRLLR